MVASDYVLNQLIPALFRKISHESSIRFFETVLQPALARIILRWFSLNDNLNVL